MITTINAALSSSDHCCSNNVESYWHTGCNNSLLYILRYSSRDWFLFIDYVLYSFTLKKSKKRISNLVNELTTRTFMSTPVNCKFFIRFVSRNQWKMNRASIVLVSYCSSWLKASLLSIQCMLKKIGVALAI